MEVWKDFSNKKVFIELKNGRKYQGTVIDYDNHFLKVIDKNGHRVIISIEEVNFIQEEE